MSKIKNSNKTAIKIFICFILTASTVATILLGINFFGFAVISSNTNDAQEKTPKSILKSVSQSITFTGETFELNDKTIIPSDNWCILIDENGNIIWSENKPSDIPERYSINDIAGMTRWFLNDYPVYIRTEDYGLFILGIPKNAVGKYDMEYSMKWFDTLPKRILIILLINIILASLLACIFGASLYRRLKEVTGGINDLRKERNVKLNEKGLFKELSKSINETSSAIERKNAALAVRDNARSNWIAGISHDIRTPLAIVIGNSETLESSDELSEANRKRAVIITAQSIKIKKLIEDLNLISSLEYDMQPNKKKIVWMCPLIRRITSNIINSGILDNINDYEIELNLADEKAAVSADEALLERAIFNLINNSIVHNKNGCRIEISEYINNSTVNIIISDNGSGVPNAVIENITEIPKSAHGLGLPMAYKIINVHGGKMTAVNNNGFTVKIKLPLEK